MYFSKENFRVIFFYVHTNLTILMTTTVRRPAAHPFGVHTNLARFSCGDIFSPQRRCGRSGDGHLDDISPKGNAWIKKLKKKKLNNNNNKHGVPKIFKKIPIRGGSLCAASSFLIFFLISSRRSRSYNSNYFINRIY